MANPMVTEDVVEQDVDIMAWAIGTQEVPERLRGSMMAAMQRLDAVGVRK